MPDSANLSTEGNVRDGDGSCGGRRELHASGGGGETQPGGGGYGSDDHGGTRTASASELVDSQRQTLEGGLRSEPREAGRDTEAERGHADAGNPDGTGSVYTAVAVASADAGLRSAIQRAQLWVSAGAQRTGRRASRTAICAGREGLGGGYRHQQVLRPRQSRHSDGTNREGDPGQTGVAVDWEVPAAGYDGGRVGGGQRGGDAARRTAVSAAGQHLSGCARPGTGAERALVLPVCRYCNIYVGSQAAAERTLVSIQAWIEKHLRLQVNAAKSGTGRVWERKFLGFRLDRKKRIGIAPVSLGEIQIQSEGDVGWQAKPHQ